MNESETQILITFLIYKMLCAYPMLLEGQYFLL
jgi:hypothetical protein